MLFNAAKTQTDRLKTAQKAISRASAILVWLLASCLAAPLLAQSTVHFDFEGPDPTWRVLASDGNGRVANQARVQDAVHSGKFSEHLRLRQGGGTRLLLAQPIGTAPIITESAAKLWVRADRPGMQMMLRVVFPRSIDPQTRQPIVTFIGGSLYQQTGHWQQLVVQDMPQALERQLRILRTEYGSQLDAREAYYDLVVINGYGGPGDTNLWLDDLELTGIVNSANRAAEASANRGQVAPVVFDQPSNERRSPPSVATGNGARPRIKFHGSTLLYNNRPVFPRVIQHNGEPFTALRELGFNAIWLPQTPTANQLREAVVAGMWLVCPPPLVAPGQRIGPIFNPVLAWHLGEELAEPQIDGTRTSVERLRAADVEVQRPVICQPDTELRSYSRLVDVVVTGRNPLGTTLSLADYANWLRERPRRARPGSTAWSLVATEPAATDRLATSGSSVPASVPTGQIRRLAYISLAAGSRGLIFTSASRLDANDVSTRRRLLQLSLLNEELRLIEAWAAAGSFMTPAQTSDPYTSAVVLQTERARLLIPLDLPPESQFVAPAPKPSDKQTRLEILSFVVPGVPASNDAYELSPAFFRPLPHKRVTGGIGLSVPKDQAESLIVLTQDALAVSQLSRRVHQSRQRSAGYLRELAAIELAEVERLLQAQPLPSAEQTQVNATLERTRGVLTFVDRSLAQQDYQQAFRAGRTAMASLATMQYAVWIDQQSRLDSPVQAPLPAALANVPLAGRFAADRSSFQFGNSLLAAGEMEQLPLLRQAGWRHFNLPQEDVRADVELSSQSPHAGRSSLHLSVTPVDANQPGRLIEAPPVWITSPALPIRSGQLVEIRGFVRVPNPIQGSVDGLLVIDSLGGPASALRLGHAIGWQEFKLYRQVPRDATLSVTFAMSGIGDAWIDDVTIRPVLAPSGPRGPAAQANRQPNGFQRFR